VAVIGIYTRADDPCLVGITGLIIAGPCDVFIIRTILMRSFIVAFSAMLPPALAFFDLSQSASGWVNAAD
jgi:hypothetical protein